MQSMWQARLRPDAVIAHNLFNPNVFQDLQYLAITHGACRIICADSGLGTDFYVGNPEDWQAAGFREDYRSRLTKNGGLAHSALVDEFKRIGKTPPLLLKEFADIARSHGLTLFMEVPSLDDELPDHVLQQLAQMASIKGHVLISRDTNLLFRTIEFSPNHQTGIILAGDPSFAFIDDAFRQGIKYYFLCQRHVSKRIADRIRKSPWGASYNRKIAAYGVNTLLDMDRTIRRFGPKTPMMTDNWRELLSVEET